MLSKRDLEFVEKIQDAVNNYYLDVLVLLGYIRHLNAECSRLRCCGNCRHLIIDIGETYWDCRAEGDSTEMWKSCSAWEERDEVD